MHDTEDSLYHVIRSARGQTAQACWLSTRLPCDTHATIVSACHVRAGEHRTAQHRNVSLRNNTKVRHSLRGSRRGSSRMTARSVDTRKPNSHRRNRGEPLRRDITGGVRMDCVSEQTHGVVALAQRSPLLAEKFARTVPPR